MVRCSENGCSGLCIPGVNFLYPGAAKRATLVSVDPGASAGLAVMGGRVKSRFACLQLYSF